MRKHKKTAGEKIWSVLTTILVALVTLAAVLLGGVRLLGYTPYAVLSGSMTPQYQVGDLVYSHEAAPEDIDVGDVITFLAADGQTVVTHRVVAADRTAGTFTTKGDANDTEDGAVPYERVLGVVRFSLPRVGYAAHYLGSPPGCYVGLMGLFILALVLLLPELVRKERPKRLEGHKGGKRLERRKARHPGHEDGITPETALDYPENFQEEETQT